MLIATAIMTVGLVMIATIFPVGVRLTGLSAERSVAAVVADEAFAKVRLYGLRDFVNWPAAQLNPVAGNPDPGATYYFSDLFSYTTMYAAHAGGDGLYGTPDDAYVDSAWYEFLYPSFMNSGEEQKYHWSALCRRTDLKDVQVTIFVTNKTFAGLPYYGYDQNFDEVDDSAWPMPVKVAVTLIDPRTLQIDTAAWGGAALDFFDAGYTIVDDYTGTIYRILEMKDVSGNGNSDIILWDDWQSTPGKSLPDAVWVVPPGIGSSRYPCVGVFQRIIRFDAIQ